MDCVAEPGKSGCGGGEGRGAPEGRIAWGALVGIGLGNTALAYCIFFNIIRHLGVANVVMVAMLVPVASVLIAHVLLHEAVGADLVLGMILIGCAMLLADGRLVAAVRRLAGISRATPRLVFRDPMHGCGINAWKSTCTRPPGSPPRL